MAAGDWQGRYNFAAYKIQCCCRRRRSREDPFWFFFYLESLRVYQGERISDLEIICLHKL